MNISLYPNLNFNFIRDVAPVLTIWLRRISPAPTMRRRDASLTRRSPFYGKISLLWLFPEGTLGPEATRGFFYGEVAEWLKAPQKCGGRHKPHRGFDPSPRRHLEG
jgi:hypothetical protein